FEPRDRDRARPAQRCANHRADASRQEHGLCVTFVGSAAGRSGRLRRDGADRIMALGWVSIVALAGWLVLALSAYRAHRVGAKATVVMGLAWVAIFFLVAAVFGAIG